MNVKGKYRPASLGKNWVAVFGKPADGWMNALPERGFPFTACDVFDLDQLKKGKVYDECVVYQEFESDADDCQLIGISADWWVEAYLNGKMILSTLKCGNSGSGFNPENNPCLAHVRTGKNLLAIRVIRGGESWSFVCSGVTAVPPLPEITFGPWLCNPDAGRISIRFLTGPGVAGGVAFRKKGDLEWLQKWQSRHGQIIRTENHLIDLEGLCPGAEYEYQILFQIDIDHPDEKDPEIHSFRVPDSEKESVSFLYTADLQFDHKTQKKYLDTMFKAAGCDDCDFFVFGGDLVEFRKIREDLLYGIIQDAIDLGASEKPLVYSRGNHELRGFEASDFPDYFAMPNGRTYGIFRYGSTAFLVLDCWEDKPRESKAGYTCFNLDREFLTEEKAYLEDALKHPEWTEAKRRIVLAHGAAYSNVDSCHWQPFRIQKMTDAWFHGKNPLYKLDLWLSGHSHIHLRSIPGGNVIAAPAEPPAPFRSGEDDVYPVLTVGGPGRFPVKASVYRVDIVPDRITVRAYDQDGKLFDHVVYHSDGSFDELLPIPHFSLPAQKTEDGYYAADDPL